LETLEGVHEGRRKRFEKERLCPVWKIFCGRLVYTSVGSNLSRGL